MAFSATTGAMASFAPSVNGAVWAIEPSGSSLYIGGEFTTVNGVARRGVAKIDATTGAVDTAFDASLPSGPFGQGERVWQLCAHLVQGVVLNHEHEDLAHHR